MVARAGSLLTWAIWQMHTAALGQCSNVFKAAPQQVLYPTHLPSPRDTTKRVGTSHLRRVCLPTTRRPWDSTPPLPTCPNSIMDDNNETIIMYDKDETRNHFTWALGRRSCYGE